MRRPWSTGGPLRQKQNKKNILWDFEYNDIFKLGKSKLMMPDSLGNPEGKQRLRTMTFNIKCKLSRLMLMCIIIESCSSFFVAR